MGQRHSHLPREEVTYSAKVPPNARPGDAITVDVAGRPVMVRVPPNVSVGHLFKFTAADIIPTPSAPPVYGVPSAPPVQPYGAYATPSMYYTPQQIPQPGYAQPPQPSTAHMSGAQIVRQFGYQQQQPTAPAYVVMPQQQPQQQYMYQQPQPQYVVPQQSYAMQPQYAPQTYAQQPATVQAEAVDPEPVVATPVY